jgi:hypothetical protein
MACQVLALINASNNSCSPAIIDYTEFYNTALDHTDLMKVLHILTLERDCRIDLMIKKIKRRCKVTVFAVFAKKKVFVRYVSC